MNHETTATHVAELVRKLDGIERRKHFGNGYTHTSDLVDWPVRRKFIAIDIGSSGAWLVERDTGEIFNIKGYGVADRNKKAKSDIGNVATVDPERMHSMRYNYLR